MPETVLGGAKLIWHIATADDPLTVKEIASEYDMTVQGVGTQVRKYYREGLLVRRKRESEKGNHGKTPYEYAIRTVPRRTRQMPETAVREPTYRCEWCGATDLHEDEIVAARTPHGAVMMCEHCCPDPEVHDGA